MLTVFVREDTARHLALNGDTCAHAHAARRAQLVESFSSICGSCTARPKSKSTGTFSVEPFAESFTDLKDIAVPFAPRHLSARESARNNVGGVRGMRVVGGGCKQ